MKKLILGIIILTVSSICFGSEEFEQYHLEALIQKSQGNFTVAEEAFKKAATYKPNVRHFYHDYGVFLYEKGDYAAAEKQFRNAINIDSTSPGDTDAKVGHYNLANVLSKQSKFKEAEEEFNKAILIDPNYHEAYYNLGELLRKNSDFKRAAQAYRKAVDSNPESIKSRINLSGSLFFSGHKEQAIEEIKKVIELDPNNIHAQKTLNYYLK